MSKPSKELRTQDYNKLIDNFYYYLSDLSKPELERFLSELLTESEIRMMHRRWHVCALLDEGFDIRRCSELAGVSTGTVQNVKSILKNSDGALSQALRERREREKIDSGAGQTAVGG